MRTLQIYLFLGFHIIVEETCRATEKYSKIDFENSVYISVENTTEAIPTRPESTAGKCTPTALTRTYEYFQGIKIKILFQKIIFSKKIKKIFFFSK